MFTGIIQEIGVISGIRRKGKGMNLRITAPKTARELEIKDSVSINGVCQTVISMRGASFEVESVEETLNKTTFGKLKTGQMVNIELPVRLNDPLGGHLVLGHIDTVGDVEGIEKRMNSSLFSIKIPGRFVKYVVPVGSIAVDGVSLTISQIENNILKVSIIPQTMSSTIFSKYKTGDSVNLEFDIIGKYIERMIVERKPYKPNAGKIDKTFLKESGF